jgi:hypothetical protein
MAMSRSRCVTWQAKAEQCCHARRSSGSIAEPFATYSIKKLWTDVMCRLQE